MLVLPLYYLICRLSLHGFKNRVSVFNKFTVSNYILFASLVVCEEICGNDAFIPSPPQIRHKSILNKAKAVDECKLKADFITCHKKICIYNSPSNINIYYEATDRFFIHALHIADRF